MVALYDILFKPLLARYDLPALTAAGGLVGALLFLPFETPVRSTASARSAGDLDRARRSRASVPRWPAT